MNSNIFDHLFVLEMASNHQGDVNRGLRIIDTFSKIARFNNVKICKQAAVSRLR